jgi:DNA polymerase
LQNLYKPDKSVSEHLDAYVRGIRHGKKIYSSNTQMELVASTIRAAFAAAPGHKFVVGDLAQIESRVLAAIAQCTAMLSAYAEGRDLYKEVMVAQLHKPLSEVTKNDRDKGKVIIRGCGYGMGWEHFIEFASTYGITLNESEAKTAVYGFRDTYPEIVSLWEELNRAVIMAFKASICIYVRGLVVDGRDEFCLKIKLLSGRYIHYHRPYLVHEPPPWGGPPRDSINFTMYGANGAEIKRLYGGMLAENVVQAISRDLLLSGMLEAETAGAKVIMTIHDEVVVEVPLTSSFGPNELLTCMTKVPEWGEGMGFVLKAECWEGPYYKK